MHLIDRMSHWQSDHLGDLAIIGALVGTSARCLDYHTLLCGLLMIPSMHLAVFASV